MRRIIAVDFGATTTSVVSWTGGSEGPVPVAIPPYSIPVPAGCRELKPFPPVVPSLIHYTPEGTALVGTEVLAAGLSDSPATFARIREHILLGSPVQLMAGGMIRTYDSLGKDFLGTLFSALKKDGHIDHKAEIVLAVPPESPRGYREWLSRTAEDCGLSHYRFIDECTAAALGHGVGLNTGDLVLMIDIGANSVGAVVTKVEPDPACGSHQLCRVLGRAAGSTGGTALDTWLYEETLVRLGLGRGERRVENLRSILLAACRDAKERLSAEPTADVRITDPNSGRSFSTTWTRDSFAAFIEKRGFFTELDRVIGKSLAAAYAKGYDFGNISAVFISGGTACIPSVQDRIRSLFTGKRVYCDRPQDCVARGAALSLSTGLAHDVIQHDYALRYWNSRENSYQYRIIVRKGLICPSPGIVARIFIRAVMDDQVQFGIPIFRLEGENTRGGDTLELVPDANGGYLLSPISTTPAHLPVVCWINEHDFPIITLDIPSARNETRLELTFAISGNRKLGVTARDLKSGKTVAKDLFAARLD